MHSWVMLDTASKDFVRLPGEQTLYTSPSRTSLALQTPNSYPGKEPLSIKCSDGKAFITNRRVSLNATRPHNNLSSQHIIASISTYDSYAPASILSITHTRSPRYPCLRALLRSQLLGWHAPTYTWRRLCGASQSRANKTHVQRRGRIRLLHYL